MPVDWTPLVELVNRHQRFLLTTHVRPDGDGLGSMLALTDTLRARGKEVHLTVASVIPPRYDFLDPDRLVERFTPPGEKFAQAEVAMVLDTGTWNQLGDLGPFLQALQVPKVVIDHHLTQDDLGGVQLVDTSAEATGRLIHEAIVALGGPLTPRAASALFVALAMDTGWFRHSNTTSATMQLGAALIEAGAQPSLLYDLLFEQNTPARLRLMGRVLSRLELTHQGEIAYSSIERGDYERTGATPQDSEDLVNFMRGIIGVEVGLFFMEQPRGGIKVSFRSRSRIDVARLAERFGGGGHRLASGAILATDMDDARRQVLHAVSAALDAV